MAGGDQLDCSTLRLPWIQTEGDEHFQGIKTPVVDKTRRSCLRTRFKMPPQHVHPFK